jgi:D-glycero-alpha-D-manno-heptose 1-phosphate guanylyltransferase
MIPAVILCGGMGTRLRGVLDDRPKCLAPIGDRTFLDLFTGYLHQQGIDEFVFATGYRHTQVEDWVISKKRPWRWTLSQEAQPLGTGGGLRLAMRQTKTSRVFAFNGDTFLEINCSRLLARHAEAGRPLTLAAVEVPDTSAFGRLEVMDGEVVDFREKGIPGPGLINGGAYVIESEFMISQPAGYLSLEKDVLTQPDFRAAAFVTRGRFLDIGTPKCLAEAEPFAEALFRRSSFS